MTDPRNQVERRPNYITRKRYEEIKATLQYLKTVGREEVQKEWEANEEWPGRPGFDAALEKHALLEARIRTYRAILESALILEDHLEDIDTSKVMVGSTVTLNFLSDDSTGTYTLLGLGDTNPREHRISYRSPIGKAILDKHIGEVVEVETPMGRVLVRIEEIKLGL